MKSAPKSNQYGKHEGGVRRWTSQSPIGDICFERFSDWSACWRRKYCTQCWESVHDRIEQVAFFRSDLEIIITTFPAPIVDLGSKSKIADLSTFVQQPPTTMQVEKIPRERCPLFPIFILLSTISRSTNSYRSHRLTCFAPWSCRVPHTTHRHHGAVHTYFHPAGYLSEFAWFYSLPAYFG